MLQVKRTTRLPKISLATLSEWLKTGVQNFFAKQGASFASYSDLDSPINNWTFSSDGGKMCSMIHINGLRKFLMTDDYHHILDRFASELAPYLDGPGHRLEFEFLIDPNEKNVKKRLASLYEMSFESMRKTNLDLKDIAEANIEKISKYTSVTDLVLCVWTIPYGNTAGVNRLFPLESSESASGVYTDSVLDSHSNLLSRIPDILNVLNIDSQLINIQSALSHIRKNVNPIHSTNWKPNIRVNDKMVYAKDFDEYLSQVPKKLNHQITPGYCSIPSMDRLCLSNRMLARSLDVERFGSVASDFGSLLHKITKAGIPARIKYTVIGGGTNHAKFVKHDMRARLATKSDEYDSINYLLKYKNKQKGTVVGIQMSASTWLEVAEGLDVAEKYPDRIRELNSTINRYYERLEACFNEWGKTETNTKNDTPLYSWTRTIAGFSSTCKGPVSFAPIYDAFRMIPLIKMSPIWNDYATRIFRTPQQEIIPFNRMAENQLYSFMVVLGAMRSGKSVFMGGMILSMATFPGLTDIPYISVIDVGRTSFGALDLIEDGLPESKRHVVNKYVMLNDAKNAINPFHLPHGLRQPIQSKKDNLISFLKLLVCDEAIGAPEGTEGFISALIEEVYKKCDDEIEDHAKIYGRGVNKKLDLWLDEINYNTEDQDVTYWELFDHFAYLGDYKKAHLCQAYASPLLDDCIKVARSRDFLRQYENDEQMQKVAVVVARAFSDALLLYPILSTVSELNLDETRVLSVDLGDVMTSGAGSLKKNAIMYSLALDITTRNFFITEESLAEVPEKYRAYHTEKYKKTKSLPKALYMDEFHRATSGKSKAEIAQLVLKQIMDYVRVSSKEHIEFLLATHLVDDISDELLELTSTQIILGVSGKSKKKVIEKFNLDDSYDGVLDQLGRPGKDGSKMVINNQTKDANYTHYVYNTVAAEEIWGMVSYTIDKNLRDGLYKLLPKDIARRALAIKFPKCTARNAAVQYEGDPDDMTEQQKTDLTDRLIKEVFMVGEQLMKNVAQI